LKDNIFVNSANIYKKESGVASLFGFIGVFIAVNYFN